MPKGEEKGAQQPQRPKWLDEWKEGKEEKEDAAPSWSRKSNTSVVASSKSEPEIKEEEEESDKEEDAGMPEDEEAPVPPLARRSFAETETQGQRGYLQLRERHGQ